MPSVIHLKETDSTNNYLKNLLLQQDIEEGVVVYADFQTAGKGQRGNTWVSREGENLMFSIVLYPNMVKANQQFIISQIVSLAVAECLNAYTSDISIKWPNDIYWKEKKICGILIENSLSEDFIQHSVIGIGININQTESENDAPNFISLKQITGEDYELRKILDEVRNTILSYYSEMKEGDSEKIIRKYKESLFRRDGYYLYNDGKANFSARIKNILPDGILVLETKEGTERHFAFKEVQCVL